MLQGRKLEDGELLDLFQGFEGEITQRYGRIGNGKTYGATADVIDELKRGRVVYVNWKIDWNGYDQRKSIFYVLASLLFPWVNKFYYFPKENLRYIKIDENFISTFSKLTDCSVYLDEGHVVFDSYEMAKMSMDKRVAVLHTRHFNRAIHIISQRPTAIHRMLRANVNRFYKYQKFGRKYPFIIFLRTEYQDITDENVDEDKPISRKLYLPHKSIMKAYDSRYLRDGLESSQQVFMEGYKFNYFMRIALLFKNLWLKARGRL